MYGDGGAWFTAPITSGYVQRGGYGSARGGARGAPRDAAREVSRLQALARAAERAAAKRGLTATAFTLNTRLSRERQIFALRWRIAYLRNLLAQHALTQTSPGRGPLDAAREVSHLQALARRDEAALLERGLIATAFTLNTGLSRERQIFALRSRIAYLKNLLAQHASTQTSAELVTTGQTEAEFVESREGDLDARDVTTASLPVQARSWVPVAAGLTAAVVLASGAYFFFLRPR